MQKKKTNFIHSTGGKILIASAFFLLTIVNILIMVYGFNRAYALVFPDQTAEYQTAIMLSRKDMYKSEYSISWFDSAENSLDKLSAFGIAIDRRFSKINCNQIEGFTQTECRIIKENVTKLNKIGREYLASGKREMHKEQMAEFVDAYTILQNEL